VLAFSLQFYLFRVFSAPCTLHLLPSSTIRISAFYSSILACLLFDLEATDLAAEIVTETIRLIL
jgi:hypothetical protein